MCRIFEIIIAPSRSAFWISFAGQISLTPLISLADPPCVVDDLPRLLSSLSPLCCYFYFPSSSLSSYCVTYSGPSLSIFRVLFGGQTFLPFFVSSCCHPLSLPVCLSPLLSPPPLLCLPIVSHIRNHHCPFSECFLDFLCRSNLCSVRFLSFSFLFLLSFFLYPFCLPLVSLRIVVRSRNAFFVVELLRHVVCFCLLLFFVRDNERVVPASRRAR